MQRLLSVRGCVYVGGTLDAVSDGTGVRPAQGLARWCLAPAAAFPAWRLSAKATLILNPALTNFSLNSTRPGPGPVNFTSPAARASFVAAVAAAVEAPAPWGSPAAAASASVTGLWLDWSVPALRAAVQVKY